MDIDTSRVEHARRKAETAEAAAARARQAYYREVARLRADHGPRATARALGITEARVYQITAKLERTTS